MQVRFLPGLLVMKFRVPSARWREQVRTRNSELGTRNSTALSSRGLGRGPLKAQTRVRIPLPLCVAVVSAGSGWSGRGRPGPFVYRFRTAPFHGAERGSIPLRAIELQVDRQDSRTAGQQDSKHWSGGGSGTRAVHPSSCPAVPPRWGRSSVWLEHSTVTREVAGSSPVAPVLDS